MVWIMAHYRFRPKVKRFNSRDQRDRYFRELDHRTDRRARRNRRLIARDVERLTQALGSRSADHQAER